MMDLPILIQILWSGLAVSSYTMLLTVAFALTLKVAKLFNFAQAGIMAIAFYSMFAAFNWLHLPPVLGFAVGLAMSALATVVIERFGFKILRERRSSSLMVFIFTLILSQFVAYVLALIFGTEPHTLFPSIVSGTRIVGGVAVSNWDLVAILFTVICMIALVVFERCTKPGRALTAVADNAVLAEYQGVDVARIYLLTTLIASAFVTVAMYLYGLRAGVVPGTSMDLLLFAVISTILGGIGHVYRAAFAAVFMGLLQSFSTLFIASRWQGVLVFGVLFVTILVFPEGFRASELGRGVKAVVSRLSRGRATSKTART